MKDIFKIGDTKYFEKVVEEEDIAAFKSGVVHEVYSTFALARDAEWACRQFVLEMKEADEEGIGTSVTVNHKAPAFVGERVKFKAVIKSINGNEIICDYQAKVGERLIAGGIQGQKILKRKKIEQLFDQAKNNVG